jgi:chitinase
MGALSLWLIRPVPRRAASSPLEETLGGPCTQSSGTLSNAEIAKIISQNGLTPTVDETAAVNWFTWCSNQWVSYDNGPTIQLKLQRANALCLGGTMVWATDLDDSNGTSTDDLLGIGTSSGVAALVASAIKDGVSQAQTAAASLVP